MEFALLKKVGLTDGEIKVYHALLHLGQSSTGKIMKKANISSSKVYLILEKLVQKGMVSFVIDNNVKQFQITDPSTALQFIDKQLDDLQQTRDQFEQLIPAMKAIIGQAHEDTAQVFKGFKGVQVALTVLAEKLEGECKVFAPTSEELQSPDTLRIITRFHKKVTNCTVIGPKSVEKKYAKLAKFVAKNGIPSGIFIGTNSVVLATFGQNPSAYELHSPAIVEKYASFFDGLTH